MDFFTSNLIFGYSTYLAFRSDGYQKASKLLLVECYCQFYNATCKALHTQE